MSSLSRRWLRSGACFTAGLLVSSLGGRPAEAAVATFPVVVGTDDAIENSTPTTTTNGDPLVVRSNAILTNVRHTGLRFTAVAACVALWMRAPRRHAACCRARVFR